MYNLYRTFKPQEYMHSSDGVDVSRFCVPKTFGNLTTSGVFEVGELVEGVLQRTGLDEDTGSTSPRISFRVAQLNHKEQIPYNSPTKVFIMEENPYTNNTLPSTFINILNNEC